MAETKSCPMCGTDAAADATKCQCGYSFASVAGIGGEAVDWTPDMGGTSSPGDNWSGWGMALVGIGVIGFALSFFMEISVSSYDSDVVNLDLMFQKGVALAVSLFLVAMGVLSMGVGAIVAAASATREG